MVGPTVSFFRNSSHRLLLCATPATIASGIYQNAFTMVRKNVPVVPIAGLAGAIEFAESEEKIENIIREAFKDVNLTDYDALILACTHYPLAVQAFRSLLGDKIHFFDPAEAVAERVEKQFWPREAGDGKMRLCITADSPHFRAFAEQLFPEDDFTIERV